MGPESRIDIYVGIDTHADTHHVGVLDEFGREIADRAFAATTTGYRQLIDWVGSLGDVQIAAVEGTSSYGAGLTRALLADGWPVRETTPGDKADRRLRGKTDAADAFTAARAALSGRASAAPKTGTGPAEILRVLQVNRQMLVCQQTQIMNQIKALLVTAPAELREHLRGLTRLQLARQLLTLQPSDAHDPITAVTIEVLADNAARWLDLRQHNAALAKQIRTLVQHHAPDLIAITGVGPDVAARLLAAVGDNPSRIGSEAAMAHLFGVAPIPASSGQTNRHRLDRGGNRSANCAVYRIALVRMAHDPRTRDYITRCTERGKTKKDAIRLLKRAIVRELYPALTQ
jgi:hypothetical protein